MKILYEDNHLFVVDKAAGLLTQPSGTDNQASLEAIAKAWIKEKYQKPGNVFLHAVHRLDKPVSGIVVFARTSKALSRMQEAMREKATRKIYIACVEGHFEEDEGFLEHYLVHDDYEAKVVDAGHPQAKKARLSYRVLSQNDQESVLEIELETGRYHQIRAQMAAIGHPIKGDKKYGSKLFFEMEGIALHHAQMEIVHPVTGEELIFNADVPWFY